MTNPFAHKKCNTPVRVLLIIMMMQFASLVLHAQEKERKWTLSGYVKDMQSVMFTKVEGDWISDNLIHNRLNFRWDVNEVMKVHLELRNRLIFGESLKYIPDYSNYVDRDEGLLDLSVFLFEEKSFLLHSSLDRAWVDFSFDKFQFRMGRQRINWSHTFVWNPNDLFNTYSFFDFDYEEKPGSDAIRAVFYTSSTSQLELALKADHKHRKTMAMLYRFNRWNYDIQFLTGLLNDEDIAFGAGWSGSLFKGGFRGEASYFHPLENLKDTAGAFLLSAGYEYVFKNSLMILFEALYNSKGKDSGSFSLNEFYYLDLSAKNLSLTRWSLMGQLSYPFTPIFSGAFSAMYSPNNHFLFLGPALTYSLADNLSLNFSLQSFLNLKDDDQAGKGSFVFLRLKKNF